MSDKEDKFFATENPDESAAAIDQPEVEGHRYMFAKETPGEGAATDQPEVEGHRYHATENPDERTAFATDQPEVEGHRISVSPASENPDERIALATDQPEVEGHRFHATEDEPDERMHERVQ